MRLLRIREVIARTGRTRSRIYEDISKGEFPQPVKIGGQAIAFVESEIDDWIASKIAERDAGLGPRSCRLSAYHTERARERKARAA